MFYKETEYKDTSKGKTPRDWETTKLEELLDLRNGQRPKVSKNGHIPIFGANGIMGYSDESLADNDFTIIFGRVGASGEVHLGEGKIWVSDNAIFSENYNKDRVYLPYLSYLLKSKNLSQFASKTTHPIITKTFLDSFSIQLPKRLEEQRGVVGVLGVVDSAVGLVDKVVWKTERLKKGLMQQLLTRGIGHKEYKDTPIGKTPKEWEVAQLSQLLEREVITYHLDGNHGELYPREEEFVSAGVPFLSANMIVNGVIDFAKTKYVTEERARQFRKGVAKDGDVLFAHNATVGPVSILRTTLPYVILGTTLTSYRCNPDCLLNYYLRYYMESPNFQKQLQRIMKQTTRNQVPITAQRKLYFVLPHMNEQKKIADILFAADKKLEIERKEKTRLERVKQGLMDLLLAGKIRIKVD